MDGESNFSKALKNARKSCHSMTQKELAKKIGIPRSTYSYYELGITKPTCELVVKVSNACNIDCKVLLEAISKDMNLPLGGK